MMRHSDAILTTDTMQIRKAKSQDAQAVLDLRNASIRQLCEGFYPAEVLSRWTEGDVPTSEFCIVMKKPL